MMDVEHWPPTTQVVALKPGVVHLWRADLAIKENIYESLWPLLSEDEQVRALRFVFAKDRTHFVAARGALRCLLAEYLGIDATDIAFAYAQRGKPSIVVEQNPVSLQFNVSHSHGQGLFAFGLGQELGVDIELIREDFAGLDVAKRFFSKDEQDRLLALPFALRTEGFFNAWTRKEAFIKAVGEGLFHALDTFDVSLEPGQPARLLRFEGSVEKARGWCLADINVGGEFKAAVAVCGDFNEVICRRYNVNSIS